MKKILSFFAAILAAVAVSATPVALPATLDVSNVSFRSEGMPDFVIEAGQDYAGTYFDMGAHDSSNDTLLYAEWDVTIEPIKYNIAVDVYNTNSWRVQLDFLNQAGEVLKAIRYKGSSGQKGQYAIGSLDLSDLAAGEYKVRARAATAWSQMKLKDVIFEADYQGVSVALPGTLLPAYAELSANASVTNNAIAFKPSTANSEYATWNVSFAAAGSFNVAIDITATNGHNYGVALLSADGQTEIGAVSEGSQKSDTGEKELGAIAVPAAGNYVVKLTNATQWSEAVLNKITFAAPAEPQTLYLKISSDWSYPAKYAIYYFNDGANGWSDFMTLVEGEDDTYVGSIPADFADDNIIFVRLNGEATTPNWNDKWSQTVNLTIPEDKDFFTVTSGGTGSECNGTWSKYGEAPAEPEIPYMAIIGDMNSWDGAANPLVLANDSLTASATIHLAMNDNGGYGFKVLIGDKAYCIEPAESWYSFHRDWTSASGINHVATENEAFWLQIDMEGDYVFTWTLADKKLEITFPEKGEVAENPWESWFTGVDNWDGETQSTLTWDAENEKATINIALDKNAQWKAQAKYHGIATQKEHFYHVALKMKANHDLGGVTLKWENNTGLIYKNQSITLTANTEYAFEEESIMATAQGGDGVLVLDFGYAKAGDVIEVYDLVIEEIDAPVVDLEDGYYIIGLNGWSIYDLTDDYLFAANIENEGEYVLEDVTLAENAEFKVVAVANNALGNWYPAEAGNYKVTANQAGVRDIYFRPDYQGGEGWHAGCIYVYVENIEPQDPVQYCEKPSGHQNDPNFGDANGRILLTIAKADGNNVIVKIKNNNEAGNTKTGLNYLWVNAQGSTGVVRYGDGSHSEADVEEVSVIVEFAEPQTSYNFINIHWAYSGWEGEWALDGLTVAADELCDDEPGTGTAISNTTVADKALKVIENGQLYIILNGVRYNAQGQME